jgi:site-specific DNA-methyltransferase (adenine-specific)
MEQLVSDVKRMDCIKYMKQFPDKFFQLAIVDPPFGIGATWSKQRNDKFYSKGKLHSYRNESIPTKRYFDLLFKKSCNQIIFGGNYFTRFLPPTNSWIVWDKVRDADVTLMSEGELAWTSFNKVLRIVSYKWDGAVKCERVEKIHPHQKPIKLYKWLLSKYAKPGYNILDTHLGSGSSRIAAEELGMNFYGCEIDKHYFEDQEVRFKKHVAQIRIFSQQAVINLKANS